MTNKKIQALLINHLQKHGALELLLPDNIVVEIGVNQIGANGDLINVDNYCWVTAAKADKMAILDSYNLGVRYSDDNKMIIFEDSFTNEEGENIKRLDVI